MQLRASVTKGTQTGLKVLWELAKVIIPAMVVVNVLDKAGVLPYISRALGPVMALFGLPGEGALVLVSANFVSFYAGLATLMALTLTWKQITILSAMMMICHGAIYETAMVARAGARAGWVLGTRVLAMVAVGLVLNGVLR
ncbi:MAG TPA: nucleoside recognition domain-containing protein [Symbiobacteriaceae bacterium]|nr:nucleoside recognition domain-containing protein [Symbiobacteriaceae bacterium]